ncbi:hypothetical protein OAJ78_04755 [Gammaproteobacteria bacterium]|nr:hypothetical protein [Gammaproteobacteria bacterium]
MNKVAVRTVLDDLVEDGVSIEGVHVPNAGVIEISRIVSHKNLKATMSYVHTADHRLHEAVDKLAKDSDTYSDIRIGKGAKR